MVMTQRYISLLGFITALLLVLFGFYCEYILDCRPCLLCLIQRDIFIVIGAVFLIAFLHQRFRGFSSVYGYLAAIISFIGILASGRQLWLQHTPTESAEVCVPGIGYLFREFPFLDAMQMIIAGSQECGRIDWQFLSLSMAGWAMIFFILFFIASIALIRIKR